MFKPKIGRPKKAKAEEQEEPEEVEEEDIEEEEEDIEENQEEPGLTKQKDTLTKQEIADIVEGNLNRALQLLQYLRA